MSTTLVQAREAFYEGSRGPSTPLIINDPVEVIGGDSAGLSGTVISLEKVDPELVFLIERGDGSGDVLVAWKHLRLVGDTPVPLRDSAKVVAFEQAARRFVALVGDPPADGQRLAEDLYRAVLGLGRAIFALPDVEPGDGPDEIGLRVDDDEWHRVYQGASHVPGVPYYDFVWPDGDQTLGDVADDVADIYRDLKPGLLAWDMQEDELVAGTVWHWKFTHASHWGIHLSGLQSALLPIVKQQGWTDVTPGAGESSFLDENVDKHPEWETNISRLPSEAGETWTGRVEIPSPTGDDSRQLVLWLEGNDPLIGFGNNWLKHAGNMEEFWDYVEAILDDQLVIGVDVGGEHDGFEDVIDLRDEDALLEHVTSDYSAPRTRIKSFGGTQDRTMPDSK